MLDRSWRATLDATTEMQALAIGQTHGLPDLLARILAGRGQTASTCVGYLDPSLREHMPDPDTLSGMAAAVDRLVKAGLIERTFCDTDRRVSYAHLVPAGAELLEEMVPVVSGELELAFAARLSERQAHQLRGTLDAIRGYLKSPGALVQR